MTDSTKRDVFSRNAAYLKWCDATTKPNVGDAFNAGYDAGAVESAEEIALLIDNNTKQFLKIVEKDAIINKLNSSEREMEVLHCRRRSEEAEAEVERLRARLHDAENCAEAAHIAHDKNIELKARAEKLAAALKQIEMYREGFEEDLAECLTIASEALAEYRKGASDE